jgi:nickel/cobalt transporter (NicO) family protein
LIAEDSQISQFRPTRTFGSDRALGLLSLAAVTIALVHTLCGPDHYIPFVAMSRVGNWSLRKTMIVTLLSGLGHVASSVVLGFAGIAAGEILSRLELIEQSRGKTAGWLLIFCGVIYLTWGIIQVRRNRPQVHCHIHGASPYCHEHLDPHASLSEGPKRPRQTDHSWGTAPQAARLTPWVLFTIFVFGPCEPLIPLLRGCQKP